ncbi:MAG: gluconate 2-dehydrogenase subunit 3 family protein [Chromatiales bacterium]|nr:gluconate 2-dehydrogenase subunit 3 family protein [Chromatiales bacterium]
MGIRQGKPQGKGTTALAEWKLALLSRRRFLLSLAGGSLLALFPLPRGSAAERQGDKETEVDTWGLLGAVQERLFPTELSAPGAREINALGYLRGMLEGNHLPQEDAQFILQGAGWLQALSLERTGKSFLMLNGDEQDTLLRQIEASEAGENWMSTVILYIFEALLTDPAYGGNPDGIGWRWLAHTPGFPRPPADKLFWRLG